MNLISRSSHHAHPVLHGQGELGETMMFGNRDVDHLIGFEDVSIKWPRFERFSVDGRILELALVNVVHFCTCCTSRRCNPTLHIAPPWVVYRPVKDLHLFCTGLQT